MARKCQLGEYDHSLITIAVETTTTKNKVDTPYKNLIFVKIILDVNNHRNAREIIQ